jgi:hypothetical protein
LAQGGRVLGDRIEDHSQLRPKRTHRMRAAPLAPVQREVLRAVADAPGDLASIVAVLQERQVAVSMSHVARTLKQLRGAEYVHMWSGVHERYGPAHIHFSITSDGRHRLQLQETGGLDAR